MRQRPVRKEHLEDFAEARSQIFAGIHGVEIGVDPLILVPFCPDLLLFGCDRGLLGRPGASDHLHFPVQPDDEDLGAVIQRLERDIPLEIQLDQILEIPGCREEAFIDGGPFDRLSTNGPALMLVRPLRGPTPTNGEKAHRQ